MVLVLLFCLAAEAPLRDARGFAMEWLRHAATWGDLILRGIMRTVAEFKGTEGF
jgi:hypothetical protein